MAEFNRYRKNTRPKTITALKPDEDTIQSQAVYIFRLQYPKLIRRLIHIPNGGKRSKSYGAKLKRLGMIKGASDLLLLVPKGDKGGLFIEVKDDEGIVSKEQEAFLLDVSADYATSVCRSTDEITKVIADYLGSRGLPRWHNIK
jgi:hypothetical protein